MLIQKHSPEGVVKEDVETPLEAFETALLTADTTEKKLTAIIEYLRAI